MAEPTTISISPATCDHNYGADGFERQKTFMDPRGTFVKLLVLILLFATPAYVSLSWNRPKFGRSEIAYAELSREMIIAKDYITPLYHWTPCIDKPVMMYWMIIPSFKLFGLTGFAARIPCILGALACIALLGLFVRKVFGWQTALMAALILSTANRYVEFSSLCMTDVFLTFFDLVTLVSLYFSLTSRFGGDAESTIVEAETSKSQLFPLALKSFWTSFTRGSRGPTVCFAIAAISSGLAVLTKGPVGFVLPAACFGLWSLWTGKWRNIKPLHIATVLSLFLVIAAPWYFYAAYKVQGPQYFLAWLWHQNVERFVGSCYDYHYPPYYMIASFFFGFAPWSVVVPFALLSFIRQSVRLRARMKSASAHQESSGSGLPHGNRSMKAMNSFDSASSEELCEAQRKNQGELLLWLWTLMTILFFTASHGKMNYYDLPAFPAAATVAAIHLTPWLQQRNKLATAGAWLFAFLLLLLGVLSSLFLPHIAPHLCVADWVLIPASLAIPGAAMACVLARGDLVRGISLGAVSIFLCSIAVAVQALPIVRKQIPALDYIQYVNSHDPAAIVAFHSDFARTVDWVDHTMFMTNKIPTILHSASDAVGFYRRPEQIYVVIPANRFAEIPTEFRQRYKVLDSRAYIGEKPPLTAIFKRGGVIAEPEPLLLVTRTNNKIDYRPIH